MGRGVWRPMGRAVFEGLLLINPLKLCRPLQFRLQKYNKILICTNFLPLFFNFKRFLCLLV